MGRCNQLLMTLPPDTITPPWNVYEEPDGWKFMWNPVLMVEGDWNGGDGPEPILPEGWEECIDEATYQHFWIDNFGQAFWEVPFQLPAGWHKTRHQRSGEVYYWNSTTNQISQFCPCAIAPWVVLWDDRGLPYWQNAITRTRTYYLEDVLYGRAGRPVFDRPPIW